MEIVSAIIWLEVLGTLERERSCGDRSQVRRAPGRSLWSADEGFLTRKDSPGELSLLERLTSHLVPF